jgi:hypothetical protein
MAEVAKTNETADAPAKNFEVMGVRPQFAVTTDTDLGVSTPVIAAGGGGTAALPAELLLLQPGNEPPAVNKRRAQV